MLKKGINEMASYKAITKKFSCEMWFQIEKLALWYNTQLMELYTLLPETFCLRKTDMWGETYSWVFQFNHNQKHSVFYPVHNIVIPSDITLIIKQPRVFKMRIQCSCGIRMQCT